MKKTFNYIIAVVLVLVVMSFAYADEIGTPDPSTSTTSQDASFACVPINDSTFGEGQSCTYVFEEGKNSFGLTITPWEQLSAKSFLDNIQSQGGNCTYIAKWTGSGWKIHPIGLPVNNFTLAPLNSYTVGCSVPSFITINGTAFEEPTFPTSFYSGQNYFTAAGLGTVYSSEEMLWTLNTLSGQNQYCSQLIDYANNLTYMFGTSNSPFDVKDGGAYFALCAPVQAPSINLTFGSQVALPGQEMMIIADVADDSPYYNVTLIVQLPDGSTSLEQKYPPSSLAPFSNTVLFNDTTSLGNYTVTVTATDFQGYSSTKTSTFTVAYTPGSSVCVPITDSTFGEGQSCTYGFGSGQNFFGLLVSPWSTLTANQVLSQIAAQGGSCDTVGYYNRSTDTWVQYTSASSVPDFTLAQSAGYAVWCNATSTLTVNGTGTQSYLHPTLYPGNQYISFPYLDAGYTSVQLLYDIDVNDNTIYCDFAKDDATGQNMSADNLNTSFGLSAGKAYFVHCNIASAPVVNLASLSPENISLGDSIVIGANITDDSPYHTVLFEIVRQDGLQFNYTPSLYSPGIYVLEFNETNVSGLYHLFVSSTDFQNKKSNISTLNFVVRGDGYGDLPRGCIPINSSVHGEGTSCRYILPSGWSSFSLALDSWEPLTAQSILSTINAGARGNDSCFILGGYDAATGWQNVTFGEQYPDFNLTLSHGYFISCQGSHLLSFIVNGTAPNAMVFPADMVEGSNFVALPIVSVSYYSLGDLLYDLNLHNPSIYCTRIEDPFTKASYPITVKPSGPPVETFYTYNVSCVLAQSPGISNITMNSGSIIRGDAIVLSVNASDDSPYFNVTFEVQFPGENVSNYTVSTPVNGTFTITILTSDDTVTGDALVTLATGTYTVTAYATDFQGHTSASNPATFTVSEPPCGNCGGGGGGPSGGSRSRPANTTTPTTPTPPRAPAAATPPKLCTENWDCSWSECSADGTQQSQSCVDKNKCGTSDKKPSFRTSTPSEKVPEATLPQNTSSSTKQTGGFAGLTGRVIAFTKDPKNLKVTVGIVALAALLIYGTARYLRPGKKKNGKKRAKKEKAETLPEEDMPPDN
ncbi:hypothetical protein HZB01_03945 [Candidatus Woesearchaeota archaeon]|nr:hypothetical protein [Candidatus Woesearchaeota archaeon]